MKLNRFATLGKIIIFTAITFVVQTHVLAQSTPDLITHYVEVTPAEDGISYNINAYFSVLDSLGNPIKDLKQEAFSIQEDGLKVEIQNLRAMAKEDPTNIVLVMDTSKNMAEIEMTNAKSAAIAFVSGLNPNDRVALITFDTAVKNQIDEFTTDRQKIIDRINKFTVTRDVGACIYDAVYSAINLFSAQPTGSRAVILFTNNSEDTTSTGAICSTKATADKVIEIASEGELRAPIYTIGLDLDLESKIEKDIENIAILKSFATKTGGLYTDLASSSNLTNTFQLLSDQLHSQYILTYNSTSKPGAHNLTVNINTPGTPDQQPVPLGSDTRQFSLSALPIIVTFTSPLEGETISDSLNIAVSLTTQGETVIERVVFEVNGAKAGADDTKPYGLELDAKQYPTGILNISAIVYGKDNVELARIPSLNIIRADATEAASIVIPPETIPTTTVASEDTKPVMLVAIALGGIVIVAIALLIFILARQQIHDKVRDDDWDDTTIPQIQSLSAFRNADEYRAEDTRESGTGALGALTVEASDDTSVIGHRFEIMETTTLGRSADNDINFPKDNPVSRQHAEIFERDGSLFLREIESMDSSGKSKSPKYGTSINDTPLGSEPVLLKTGDEILLGKRVRLRFEAFEKSNKSEGLTYDDLTASDDIDKTQDQF